MQVSKYANLMQGRTVVDPRVRQRGQLRHLSAAQLAGPIRSWFRLWLGRISDRKAVCPTYCADVISNLLFFAAGLWGLILTAPTRPAQNGKWREF